jgi:ATP-dependent Clp protease ATP-binding subunit ClpA
LLGLLREEEGLAARVLASFEITVERVRAQILRIVGSGEEPAAGQIPFTPRAKKVLELALREALSLGPVLDDLTGEIRRELQRAPDTGDLLLALAGAPDTLAGLALRELAANLDGLPAMVERIRARALAEDELAHRIEELTEAKEQAIKTVAQLRAQERELREQAQARTAVSPEALQEIRRPLGIPEH